MLNRLADIGVSITPAAPADLDQVLAIETLCFPAPWSRQAFEAEFQNHFSRFIVARTGGDAGAVVGFAIYWLVEDEAHIINFAVRPEIRRRGIGREMLERIVGDAVSARCRIATLEVRTGNAGAIALYRGFGFIPAAVRQKYYVDNGEDALVMILEIAHGR